MTDLNFTFESKPARIVFGRGVVDEVENALDQLGAERALVLSTEFQKEDAEQIATRLGNKCLGVYAKATMHTPTDVTDAAMVVVAEQNVDCLISFGGGSTIGLGKAIAYRSDLPQIAIPTTYAGSEVTPILGETENGKKVTLQSPRVLPEVVLYDPAFLDTLPMPMTVTSGLNAIAHGIEALYAQDRNPVSSMMAAEGVKSLIQSLPKLKLDPRDPSARNQALYGSWLCGSVLGQVGMALHHKICHTLGGAFNLPHAETHSVMLPHATAYNETAVKDVLAPIKDALGASSVGKGLHEFAIGLDAPTSLKDLGMPETGVAMAADLAMANPYWNPRALERDALETLIRNAFEGNTPQE